MSGSRRRLTSRALLAGTAFLLALSPLYALTDGYRLDVGRTALYLAALTATWSLLAGVAGQFSFAHVAIAGLAGYASAIWSQRLEPAGGAVASIWAGIAFGVLFATLLGVLLGLLLDRLRGAYLALFTIAFAVIAQTFVLAESELTGGAFSLPVEQLPGSPRAQFELVLALLALVVGAIYWVLHSSWGVLLRAVREDEDAAAAMGVDVRRLKLAAFSLTSAAVGLAAAVYFHTTPRIAPDSVGLLEMTQVLAFAVIGGLESPFAGAVAAIVLSFVLEYLRQIDVGAGATLALGVVVGAAGATVAAGAVHHRRPAVAATGATLAAAGGWLASLGGVHVDLSVWRLAAFGALLVLTLRFLPNGLLTPLLARLDGREAAARGAASTRAAGTAAPGGTELAAAPERVGL